MSAQIIDGKAVAEALRGRLAQRAEQLRQRGVEPTLAVILVGEDPASQVYVRNKERACKKAGIRSILRRLAADTAQEALEREVTALNEDAGVHGILVQLPLPKHLDEQRVLDLIDPRKDVDGFHPVNSGRLMNGQPGFVPCTPKGALHLIEQTGTEIAGKHAVVVGRSNIVGKPMALLLLQKHATVTICHSRTRDLASVTRQADILVVAVGRANFITGDMVKPGAIVIDVGINRLEDGLTGDVDFESALEVAGAITPVPGGVGPMTIAMLLSNTLDAAERTDS